MAGLNSVGFSNCDNEVDLEGLRTRLRKMNDAELLRFGRAAKFMCEPDAYFGQAPRQTFVVQLEEARAEHPESCRAAPQPFLLREKQKAFPARPIHHE